MFDESSQVTGGVASQFCEGYWEVIHAFFHPELSEQASGDSCIDALFEGVLSETIGLADEVADGSNDGLALPCANENVLEVPATIVFESYGITRRNQYWRAEIAVSKGLPIGEAVVVSVLDADGEKIERATLRLLGSDLSVSNGIAAYDLASFQRNLRKTDVALIYPSGECVEGTLKFGDED